MSFAFDLAWNVNSIAADGFDDYFHKLATREFGDKFATRIAKLWYGFERLVALRKHEHIEPGTFSILKYNEARKILFRWFRLKVESDSIYAEISPVQKPAFLQLVLHPIEASYVYNILRITQSRNQLYARQRRNTANILMKKCIQLFDADLSLTEAYHTILSGKWKHILRQPHYGYTNRGLGPSRDMIDGLSWVRTNTDSNPSVGHMGIAVEGNEGINPGIINEDSDRTHPSRKWLEAGVTLQSMSPYDPQGRYFEIFHRGTVGFTWEAKPQYDWIKLSLYEGRLDPNDDDIVILVTIDWKDVPQDFEEKAYVEIIGSVDGYEKVRLVVQNRQAPAGFSGFVESDGYISIDSGNWVNSPYIRLPALGRQGAGTVTLPNDLDMSKPDRLPFLRYDVYTFEDHEDADLELHFNMTLETDPDSRMEYDICWDGGEVRKHRLTEDPAEGSHPDGWSEAVQDCVWKKRHGLGKVNSGSHCIEIRFRSLNIALKKLVIDLEGIEMKYLGPPESDHVTDGRRAQIDATQKSGRRHALTWPVISETYQEHAVFISQGLEV